MARWEPDSRGRLEQAALALYGERGFEQHHRRRDRRARRTHGANVLPALRRQARGSVRRRGRTAGAPRETPSPARLTRRRRSTQSPRRSRPPAPCSKSAASTPGSARAIIAANAELRERELIKLASLAAALADALRQRGVRDPAASLTAEAGIAVFRVAFERWVERDRPARPVRSSSESRSTSSGRLPRAKSLPDGSRPAMNCRPV